LVYETRRESSRPPVSHSVLRETTRIVVVSVAASGGALLLLMIIRAARPELMPDPGAWLRDGRGYLVTHYRLVARSMLFEVLLACLIAFIAAPRRTSAGGRHVLTPLLWTAFHAEDPATVVLTIRMKTGEVYQGRLHMVEHGGIPSDRLVTLRHPLAWSPGKGQDLDALPLSQHAVVLAFSEVSSTWISYLEPNPGDPRTG